MLSLDRVTVKLGQRTFGPFSFAIQPGERVAVLGPSGAGKSTLLKLLARELSPASGHAGFCQQPLQGWSLPDLSRRRAILPQSYEVAFGLPVDLVIGLGRVSRMHDPSLASIVQQAAEQACAAHLLGRRAGFVAGR
ncbi:metal abc transporter, putative [Ricinus communis]|uniref:Metal abc transporter, putative n=1 Tax=Ricinus communis TaxID=3988 RepID=B9TBU2_RICCO|nr:metal abc transporter, putative [Ricinus communis]